MTNDHTRPRAFAPTPDSDTSLRDPTPASSTELAGRGAAASLAVAAASSPADRCPDGCRCTHCRCMRAAFARYARAVAAELNR
jgi:hypothetical protein